MTRKLRTLPVAALAALVGAALALASPSPAEGRRAGQESGNVSGRVTDASGNVVEGAKVVVRGLHQGATTTVRGEFILVGVPAGEQILDATAPDARQAGSAPVTVRPGAMAHADIRVRAP